MFYPHYEAALLLHHLQVLLEYLQVTFSITSGFVKTFLNTIRNKKKEHNKIVMLARRKLNSTESKISKALMDNEISHEDFETIINEEKKY